MKILLLLFISINLFAQNFSLSGYISDSTSGESLSLANVFIGELDLGTTSDEAGSFVFNGLPKGSYSLRISFIGYQSKIVEINLVKNTELKIDLSRISLLLDRAIIEGTYPKFRETAVAFSELTGKDINNRLGTREAINILEGTPSAYISQQGGGIGEQRLNLRGFDQTNISVMINGIPINNPENGEIYWSNWAGISDLVQYVHVQRGLSAIPYSISSIGGSVNFVTNGSTLMGSNYKIRSEFGSDNLYKTSFSFSNQLSENIGLTGLVSRRTIDGYSDQVFSDEFTYYFSLGLFWKKHTLQIQLLGSPQKHGQRLSPLTQNEWINHGKRYNADWGYLNGKSLNLRDNEFHNPTLNINYNWELSKNIIWSNILSLSHGTGGGTVPPWFPFFSRTESGLIDFDKEWALNSNNIDPTFHPTKNKSVIALRKGIHKNYWGTLISVLKYNYKEFTFSAGIDGKLYEAQNYNELSNLLGGDYAIWSNNVNEDPNKLLTVGDKVDFNADSFTRNFGAFIQTEYKKNKISAYFNASFSSTDYNRIDYFNYLINDSRRETGWKNFTSHTIKAGLNYNFNEENNLYVNVGNFSRAPLSQNVYDYSNNLYENVKNENILSFEVGYGLKYNFVKFNANYFNTTWEDKAFSQAFLGSDSNSYYYNIFGASAKHSGIELDASIKLVKNIILTSMFSYSTNKWTSDVDAFIRPEANPTAEISYRSFTKDLYVGNFPMTTASVGLYYEESIKHNLSIYFNPIYNFYGRYFAQYSPELRTIEGERNIQSWRLPDFFNIDIHSGMEFNFGNEFIKSLKITFDIFNVLNQENIVDAIDGLSHDSNTARVWFGRGRWWSSSLTVAL